MNALEFCAKHYARSVLPTFNGADINVIANVFESTLEFQKMEDGALKTVKLSHTDKFGYLVISEDGYWARNAHRPQSLHPDADEEAGLVIDMETFAKQRGAQSMLLPKFASSYSSFEKVSKTALFDVVRNWDKKPFLAIEMGAKQFDFYTWQLTYDIRHVVINSPSGNRVINAEFLLDLKEDACTTI